MKLVQVKFARIQLFWSSFRRGAPESPREKIPRTPDDEDEDEDEDATSPLAAASASYGSSGDGSASKTKRKVPPFCTMSSPMTGTKPSPVSTCEFQLTDRTV